MDLQQWQLNLDYSIKKRTKVRGVNYFRHGFKNFDHVDIGSKVASVEFDFILEQFSLPLGCSEVTVGVNVGRLYVRIPRKKF